MEQQLQAGSGCRQPQDKVSTWDTPGLPESWARGLLEVQTHTAVPAWHTGLAMPQTSNLAGQVSV